MNSSIKFVAAALLFSALSLSASDYDYCRSDNKIMDRVAASLEDVEAGLLYVAVDCKIPDNTPCKYALEIKNRTKKAIVKYFINKFLLHNSIDIVADLPNGGTVTLLTTDQAMEIGYTVFNDVFVAKKAGPCILADAGKTFLREKIVSWIVWLLAETHAEALLPDTLTSTTVYHEARNEIARYFVDKGINRVLE